MAHVYNKNISKKIKKYDDKRTKEIQELLNCGKKSQALKFIRTYLKDYPTDERGLLLYVKCLLKSDDEEAKRICLQIVEDEVKSLPQTKSEAFFLLGSIEARYNNQSQAEEYYQNAADLGSHVARYELCKLLISRLDSKRALEVINSIDEIYYDNRLYQLKATILYHLDRYEEALEMIEKVDVSSSEKDLFLFYYTKTKAKIYESLNRDYEAEQILEAYTLQFPVYDKNHCLLIECYLKRKKIKEAYSLCDDLMKNAPEDIKLYARLSLGNIYRELGDFTRAKEEYQKAINKDNYDVKIMGAYTCLGELALIEKNYEEAKSYFQKINSGNEVTKIKKDIFMAIVELKLQNYSKAYKLIGKIDAHKVPIELQEPYKQMQKVLLHQRNKIIDDESYFAKQLVHYDKKEAIKHIKRGHQKGESTSFFDWQDIAYLFRLAPSLIENAVMIENRVVEKYLVFRKNVGYCKGELTDYMHVVVFPGTTHVLTMYPVEHISEEELKKEEKIGFQKKKLPSQIEKFNARYRQKK